MKKKILILVILFFSVAIFASDNAYNIEYYTEIIDVNENGSLSFDGQIDAHFNDLTRHGIYVAVPLQFDGKLVDITNFNCLTHEFQRSENKGHKVLRIGKSSEYVNENEEYIYHYDYDSHADKYDDYDEFYFNVLGDNVTTTVDDFYCVVNFPKPIPTDMIFLTSGTRGSEGNNVNAKYTVSEDRKTIEVEAYNIDPYNAITLRVQLPEGYFVNPTPIATTDFVSILNIYVVMLVFLFILWYIFGRDKKPIYAVEFYPPKGISPMDMGFIIDSKLDNKDMTAMIFYWADKGYCEINNIDTDYEISVIKDIDDSTTQYEKDLFNILFYKIGKEGVLTKYSKVDEEDTSFKGDLDSIKSEQKKHLTKNIDGKQRKLYSTVSQVVQGIASVLFVLSALMAYILFIEPATVLSDNSTYLSIVFGVQIVYVLIMLAVAKSAEVQKLVDMQSAVYSVIIGTIVFSAINFGAVYLMLHKSLNVIYGVKEYLFAFVPYYLYVLLGSITVAVIKKKSKEYIELLGTTLGFYDFINKVEITQLKLLINEDPQYYYKTLSYAIVLGLENTWAKKFSTIDMDIPHWTNSSSFTDAIVFSTITSSVVDSVSSSIQTSLPSSYSGSSYSGGSSYGGGGFSGGGGGGGGVGSW